MSLEFVDWHNLLLIRDRGLIQSSVFQIILLYLGITLKMINFNISGS